MSRSGTDIAIEAMLSDQETLRAEIGELRAENERLQKEVWQIFETNGDLGKVIAEQMAKIERLWAANRYWEGRWRDEAAKNKELRATLREDRRYLAGLCGCAASSGCGAAIRRAEIDRLLNSEQSSHDPNEGLPTAADVRGILKPQNER